MYDDDRSGAGLGLWLLVVAGVVGLFLLLLQPSARADELDATTRILLERSPPSADDRLAAAEQLLDEERLRKSRGLVRLLLDGGMELVSGADPRRIARVGWRVARSLWAWHERSDAEDQALELLELGIAQEDASAALTDLHARLRARELEERTDELLVAAEEALEDGHRMLARVRLQRSLELVPADERADALLAQLAEPLEPPAPDPDAWVQAWTTRDWEAPIAAAMLAGDYSRAASLAPEEPRGRLVLAAASYLDGDRRRAREVLSSLRGRPDTVGETARAWAGRPDLLAGARFESERRRYYLRKVLGVFGGDGLAKNGLDRDWRGLDAWRSSLGPLNLALAFPARLVRGWTPDGSALREAATVYLEFEPDGIEAESASHWLEQLGPAPEPRLRTPWRGHRLVLPRPRTLYTPLAPRPLVLTASALRSGRLGDVELLRDVIGDAEAVLLRAELDAVPVPTLTADDSLALLAALGQALGAGTLETLREKRPTSFERLQRLEAAVRSGARLVAVPYGVAGPSLRAVLPEAILDGGTHYADAMRVSRGADKIRVDRKLGGAGFRCPATVLCVHRPTTVSANLYGGVDSDADLLLGGRASFQHATLALEVRSSGPHASLTLPLARWFGIERWVPVAARAELSAEGLYLGPVGVRASVN
jgi:hypothetical protein